MVKVLGSSRKNDMYYSYEDGYAKIYGILFVKMSFITGIIFTDKINIL